MVPFECLFSLSRVLDDCVVPAEVLSLLPFMVLVPASSSFSRRSSSPKSDASGVMTESDSGVSGERRGEYDISGREVSSSSSLSLSFWADANACSSSPPDSGAESLLFGAGVRSFNGTV